MVKSSIRGSLLFETFVALMILSIAITSALRVFGEALNVSRRNQIRRDARFASNHLLFSWFANPGSATLPEGGVLTLPLKTEQDDILYWGEIRPKNLSPPKEESKVQKKVLLSEQNAYYNVSFRALTKDQRREIFNLETVVFKVKKGGV